MNHVQCWNVMPEDRPSVPTKPEPSDSYIVCMTTGEAASQVKTHPDTPCIQICFIQEAFGACGSGAHSIRGGSHAPVIARMMERGGLTGSAQQWPKRRSSRGGCRGLWPKESMAAGPCRLGLRIGCPSPPYARLNIRGRGADALRPPLHGAKPVSRDHGLAAYGESSPHGVRAAAEGDGVKDAVSRSVSSGGGGGGDGGGYIDGKTATFTALASASILVSYADRGNLASAIVPMGEEFGWSPGFEGLVLSSFFVGYATTQVSFGGSVSRAWHAGFEFDLFGSDLAIRRRQDWTLLLCPALYDDV